MILNKIIYKFEAMYEQLIEYYKMVRKAKGINQEDAAKFSKTNPNAIGRMERMDHSPSLEAFCRMAEGIGMMVVLAPLPKKEVESIVDVVDEAEKKEEINWDEFNTEE